MLSHYDDVSPIDAVSELRPEYLPLVYTAGYYNDIDGPDIACNWTGGTKIDLSGTSGSARSICVPGGTVYSAGMYNDGTTEIAVAGQTVVRIVQGGRLRLAPMHSPFVCSKCLL